jgi:AraC-like DNA-binding protein
VLEEALAHLRRHRPVRVVVTDHAPASDDVRELHPSTLPDGGRKGPGGSIRPGGRAGPGAAERLRGNPASLGEVAAPLGYADQAHVTRDFSRVTAMTPGRFAARHVPGS